MKKMILLLITITIFTNVSYASFPVVEKVSNQTTGSMIDPLFIKLIIWAVVGVPIVWFLRVVFKMNQRSVGWRRKFLDSILGIFAVILMIIWIWIGLGCIIGFC